MNHLPTFTQPMYTVLQEILNRQGLHVMEVAAVPHGGWVMALRCGAEVEAAYVAEALHRPVTSDVLARALDLAHERAYCLHYIVSPAGLTYGAQRFAIEHRLAVLE